MYKKYVILSMTLTLFFLMQLTFATPTVSWNYPSDDSFNTSWTFNVGFTPADDIALDNCTLRDNRSGAMLDTVTNTSVLINDSVNTIAETFTADGHYNISIKCWDTSSNIAETVGRLIKVDATSPTVSSYYQWDADNTTVDFGLWTEGFVSVNWNLTDTTGINISSCLIKVRNKDIATNYTNLSYLDDVHHPDYDITTGYKNLTCYTSTFDDGTIRVSANMTRSYDWRPLITALDQDSAAHDNSYANFGDKTTRLIFHNISNTINTTFIFLADVANQTNTVADLLFYSCNSSYTSGDFTTSQHCTLVGAAHPNATRDVNFGYLIGALTTDENGMFGGVVHTETMYGMSYCPSCTNANNAWLTYSTNGYDGHSETSSNRGSQWSALSGEEFNVILHTIDNTQLEFNLTIDDNLGNQLSVLQTDIYGALANLVPFGDIMTDNVTGGLASYHDIHNVTESGTICINVTVSDPNADDMNVSIYLLNNDSTANSTLLTDYAVSGYGIICHQWDTTTIADGDYRLNVTAFDGSLTGYDESSGYIRIDNTVPIVTITSPTNYTNTTTSINITGSITELHLKNCTTNTTEYSTTITSNSSFTFEYQSALTEKDYHVLISCYDEAENLGTGLVIFTFYNETYSDEVLPDDVYADSYETVNVTLLLNTEYTGFHQFNYTIPYNIGDINASSITVKNNTDGNISYTLNGIIIQVDTYGTQDPYYITYDVKLVKKMTVAEYGFCPTGSDWQTYTDYCRMTTSTETKVTYEYRYYINVTVNDTNQSNILHNRSTSIFTNFGLRTAGTLVVSLNSSSANTTSTVLSDILQYNVSNTYNAIYSLNKGIYEIKVLYDVMASKIPPSTGGGSRDTDDDDTRYVLSVCGNGICEWDESYENCSVDCSRLVHYLVVPTEINYSLVSGAINKREITIENNNDEIVVMNIKTVCSEGYEEICNWNWFVVDSMRSTNLIIDIEPHTNKTFTLYTYPPITALDSSYSFYLRADVMNEGNEATRYIYIKQNIIYKSEMQKITENIIEIWGEKLWGDDSVKAIPYTSKTSLTVGDLAIIIAGLSAVVLLFLFFKGSKRGVRY